MSLSSADASSLSSILLLSSSSDPFDYPDYAPVPSTTTVKPSISIQSSQHSIPPSVENMIFQEGIPIQIVRSNDANKTESSLTFTSFVVYRVTGTMVSEES